MKTSQNPIPKQILIEIIYAETDKAIRNYFDREGFVKVRAPFISGGMGSCENPKTLFEVNYLDKRTYLRQSGQLYLEMYMPFLEKVWCEGPSFRAEQKVDDRHLAEFNLYEFEFCGNFQQLLIHIENFFSEIIHEVSHHAEQQLLELDVDADSLRSVVAPFPRITYKKAVEILGLKWGSDLKREHEKALVELYGSKPLFITHFPRQMKFFNMKVNEEDTSVVNSADLILPFSGETVGAAEREFRYDAVYERLLASRMLEIFKEEGVGIDAFRPYLDHLKEKGSVLHAGCGIGLERVIQFLLGVSDIRKASAFLFL